MKKIVKEYTKCLEQIAESKKQIETHQKQIADIGRIDVSPNNILHANSTDKSFIYGLGIVRSQIDSCTLLGIPSEEYNQKFNNIILLHRTKTELNEMLLQKCKLQIKETELWDLMSSDDKFPFVMETFTM
ncbi:MAG: hypothetical protein EBQ89_01725 [Alphaproteobacteria bacterium]|nr:hypothetical protein [Alphaproteobacteria bacterium]